MVHAEHNSQCAVIAWCNLQSCTEPRLEMIFAIPNGAHLGMGGPRKCARLKAEGLKPGVPDLFLAAANEDYFGLFIEMKSPTGVTSKAQVEWIAKLATRGYRVAVCRTALEAIDVIREYLNLDA